MAYVEDYRHLSPRHNELSSRIEIFVKIRNVPKLDYMSPSDPFVIFSLQDGRTKRWNQFAFTEIVWDDPNPEFVKPIVLEYMFEEVQNIRLDVYDADSNDLKNLANHDYIGYFEFLVGDLVSAKGQKLSGQLRDRKGKKIVDGSRKPTLLSVRCEEVSQCLDEVAISFRGIKLPKMDWFTSIDGYLTIYRSTEDGNWLAVAQTNVVKNNKNPRWDALKCSVQRLCNGDYQRPLLIKLFDWNWNAEPDYAGEVETTLAELQTHPKLEFKKRKKKGLGKKCRGFTVVDSISVRQKHSFLEYLAGGTEIQLMIAVDFTASNGDPRDSKSLHYMGGGRMNDYQKALTAVGAVLEPYDHDNMIPAYGFGAKDHRGMTQHCFALNGNPADPEVHGIQGVLDAYNRAIQSYTLSGPTLFSEIIDTATAQSMSPQTQDEQHFTILMIITDGVLNDMQRTVDSIVAASDWPVAIIIVGVGNADFDAMDTLDADDEPLINSQGQQMKADIVQFVPFNQFKHSAHLLAKEVLEEVPEQLTGFFDRSNIAPLPPRRRNSFSQSSYGSDNEYAPEAKRGPVSQPVQNYGQQDWHLARANQAAPPPPSYNNVTEQLPPGWEKRFDENSQRYFFIDHNTQATHWNLP